MSDEAKEALEWMQKKLGPKAPPRGQYTGPFSKGPRAYVPCPMCTNVMIARDPDYKGTVGTSKQHQRQHLKDHRLAALYLKQVPA